MKISIIDPAVNEAVELELRPERIHQEQGYRVTWPNGSAFLIANRYGTWRPADDHLVDPELLIRIGMALEGQQ